MKKLWIDWCATDMKTARNALSQYLPFLFRKPQPSRKDLLKTRPTRNPVVQWERSADGETVLKIPRRTDFVGTLLHKLLRAPDYKTIVLDDIGSDVWELCDGKHTLDSIIVEISRRHKITRRECEVSVSTYLKTLSERSLVGIPVTR